MIIDQELFRTLSFGSGKRVLCQCDECGTQKRIIRQAIRRSVGDTYTLCHSCNARIQGKSNVGIVRDAEHRRKTGEASRARNAGQRIGAWNKATPLRGALNGRWNPDREFVARNALAHAEASSLLNNCLKRTKTGKTTPTEKALGYKRLELLAHIESLFLPGMTWEDRSLWQIDHKKPVAVFIAEGIDDLKIINALSNLRPLWTADNLSRRFNDWRLTA